MPPDTEVAICVGAVVDRTLSDLPLRRALECDDRWTSAYRAAFEERARRGLRRRLPRSSSSGLQTMLKKPNGVINHIYPSCAEYWLNSGNF